MERYYLFQKYKKTKEKKRKDLTQFYDKSPYINRKVKSEKWTTKTQPNTSITQRLLIDLGRSVGKITATQLVWLTSLRAKPSDYSQ